MRPPAFIDISWIDQRPHEQRPRRTRDEQHRSAAGRTPCRRRRSMSASALGSRRQTMSMRMCSFAAACSARRAGTSPRTGTTGSRATRCCYMSNALRTIALPALMTTARARASRSANRPTRSLSASIARDKASRAFKEPPLRRADRLGTPHRVTRCAGAVADYRGFAARAAHPAAGTRGSGMLKSSIARQPATDSRHRVSMFRRSQTPRESRPRVWAAIERGEPAAGRSHRADRLGELREPGGDGRAGLAAHQQVRRRLSGQALLRRLRVRRHRRAARDRPREEAVPRANSRTCSRIRARRPTRRCSSRRSSPATRSSA